MSPSLAIAAVPAREKQAYEPATVVRRVAQELRQPLGTIESISHYLDMVLPRTEVKARRQLAKLQDEVRHMHWTLADALHFLQAAPLKPHLLDLTEVVSKSLNEWNALEFDLDPDLPLARLDLEQMQHLLRNTVTFFRRVSAHGRAVRLRTYSLNAEVVLEISSNALEFRPEDLEPLFEPFEENFPAGSGLGLASARKIADAHGARMSVTPDPPRRLTVSIAFPAA